MVEHVKIRKQFGALGLLGLIYLLVGTPFVLIGIFLSRVDGMFLVIFGTLGGIFVLLGGTFLTVVCRKNRRAQKVVDGGKYFWGEVVDVERNTSVHINGRSPSHLVVKMRDPMGNSHIFKSRDFTDVCFEDPRGKQVKVYAEEGNLRNYYVDAEPILRGTEGDS